MATTLVNLRNWSCTREETSHREYKAKFLVKGTLEDGPANALQTPGLPIPGETWLFKSDRDDWAWCHWNASVTPVVENEPGNFFEVEVIFSTKPPTIKECRDTQVEDPLSEPMKVTINFVKSKEEAAFDRFGARIVNSAHEQIRGPLVEFDLNRFSVKIVQNVADLQLPLIASMKDCVNGAALWGMPPRTVRLAGFSSERVCYRTAPGTGTRHYYFIRTFEFDVDIKGFDRNLADEATKVLKGHFAVDGRWVLDPVGYDLTTFGADGKPLPIMPDVTNPTHFIRYQDQQGNNARILLNGAGIPATLPEKRYTITGAEWSEVDIEITFTVNSSIEFQVGSIVVVSDINPPTYAGVYTVLELGPPVGTGGPDSFSVYKKDDPGAYDPSPVAGTGTGVGTQFPGTVIALGSGSGQPGNIHVEKYDEADFLELGIPSDLTTY